jgi:predicted transcriptional regulator
MSEVKTDETVEGKESEAIELIDAGEYSIKADVLRDLKSTRRGDMLVAVSRKFLNIDDLFKRYDDMTKQVVRDYKEDLKDHGLIREAKDGSTYKTLFTATSKGEHFIKYGELRDEVEDVDFYEHDITNAIGGE